MGAWHWSQASPVTPPSAIMNFDEIPLPFEYFNGYTYIIKGSKSINSKTNRSG